MVHLITGVKQNESKQHKMSMLDEITELQLSDWTHPHWAHHKLIQFYLKRMKMNILEKRRDLFTKNIEGIKQKRFTIL